MARTPGIQPRSVTPIQARRFELGITQQELARLARMNSAHISLLERGRYLPTLDEWQRLADVLNVERSVLQRAPVNTAGNQVPA
jgi:transcriptional regulator with XRE-family HTH domain